MHNSKSTDAPIHSLLQSQGVVTLLAKLYPAFSKMRNLNTSQNFLDNCIIRLRPPQFTQLEQNTVYLKLSSLYGKTQFTLGHSVPPKRPQNSG